MTIEVNKGNVTEGSMNLFNIAQMARSAIKVSQELENVLTKLISLSLWQANKLPRNIPKKSNKSHDKGEPLVTLLIMPRHS